MTGTNLAQAKAFVPFYGTSFGSWSWSGLMEYRVGSQICAYGAIQIPEDTKVPVFSCSMDDQPARSYIPGTFNDGSAECYCNVTFPLAVHNLTITNLLGNSFLYLDYFLVSKAAPNTSSAAISSTSIGTSSLISSPSHTYNQPFQTYSPSISNSVMTVYSPMISPVTAINPTSPSSQNYVKMVVGIVGGLTLLIISGLMGIWFVRRRRRANRWKAPSAMFVNSSMFDPDYSAANTGSKAYLKQYS